MDTMAHVMAVFKDVKKRTVDTLKVAEAIKSKLDYDQIAYVAELKQAGVEGVETIEDFTSTVVPYARRVLTTELNLNNRQG